MKFSTKAVHAGVSPDKGYGAVMTPIYQTSTFAQQSPGVHQGYEYARTHNPTRTALQNCIAELENGQYGICFSSGMAAIDAVLKLLKPGDEVLCTQDLYGGTYRIFTKVYAAYGINFHFVNMMANGEWQKFINDKTKLIWIETPTNPLLHIIDIAHVCNFAKNKNIYVAIDNTFASPYLQRPLTLGADIVVHSATKYLGGHSDVVLGAVIVNAKEIAERLYFLQNACGAVPGPQDCFLVLRGIKTLHLRMKAHCENALKIAEWLSGHHRVKTIYYPGLTSHAGYETAQKQMHMPGGMLSFDLKEDTKEAAVKVLERFKIFTLAESLGGVESLCGHPATMTHASIPKEEREKIGLKDSLIRLSVGIEDADDLIEDLKQALDT
ncbi:MAG: cystathionine gamma-synthase [Cytophagaceae bacterium]|nr:cystathionine gamma-synthase [Cytophagaceae bacterium]MDW8456867.1 cystathionine gamma-synthase [Cytophagaceae bacterium]